MVEQGPEPGGPYAESSGPGPALLTIPGADLPVQAGLKGAIEDLSHLEALEVIRVNSAPCPGTGGFCLDPGPASFAKREGGELDPR